MPVWAEANRKEVEWRGVSARTANVAVAASNTPIAKARQTFRGGRMVGRVTRVSPSSVCGQLPRKNGVQEVFSRVFVLIARCLAGKRAEVSAAMRVGTDRSDVASKSAAGSLGRIRDSPT